MKKLMNIGVALKVTCVGFVAGVVLRVIGMLYAFDYDTGFYTDGGLLAGCCLGAVILASVLGAVMCHRDRESLGAYVFVKDSVLGAAGLLSGAVLLLCGGLLLHDLTVQGAVRAAAGKAGVPGLVFAVLSLAFGAVQLFAGVDFITGKGRLAKVPLLYLTGVAWGVDYLIMVYVTYAHSSSLAENFFAVVGGSALVLALFYLCRCLAGVGPKAAAHRLFITGIAAVVLVVTHSISDLTLMLLGAHYDGEIPWMIQLATLITALFVLTFLATYRREVRHPESTEQPAGEKPGSARGGRRFRVN